MCEVVQSDNNDLGLLSFLCNNVHLIKYHGTQAVSMGLHNVYICSHVIQPSYSLLSALEMTQMSG